MTAILDTGLELLLKYRPALYAQGRLAFDARPGVVWGLALVSALVVAVVAWTYHARARRSRVLLASLRVASVLVLVACLLRPVLVLDAAVPRRNTVAVLVDDSRSMRVRDWNGRPRADFARETFADAAPLRRALGEQFAVRLYRFSDLAAHADSVGALAFAGDRTRLGAALDQVREELDGVPLAGLVVVSDGADGAPTALADAASALRARGMPVFTIGVGAESAARDVEVRRVEAPRSALMGSTVAVDVVVAHHGLAAGDSVPVVVEENGRILARRAVVAPTGGEAVTVRVPLPLADAGTHHLTVRVPPRAGETTVENNARALAIDVRDEREAVLYFEGEPRFEAKFLRRAVADDRGLRVVLLQRTAEGKYLRLGVEDSLDLVSGFPTSRDVLFKYKAIILGSVEASAFTADQLRMVADFVSVRGGSLVLLGGRRALAEGSYAGTALEDAIPIVLERNQGGGAGPVPASELAVRLTPAGAAHVPLQLAADEPASLERWRTLPPLTAVNVARRAKPGATVLLTGTVRDSAGRDRGDERIVMAYQRYGRGKVVAMPVQDTWVWQMHASIPVEDMTHEQLWRQTLRWLTSDVPDPVEVTASVERPAPGEPVELRATVRDSHFVAINGATVVARVTAPSGATSDVPLTWSVARDGEYRGAFTPAEEGAYDVQVRPASPERRAQSAEGTDDLCALRSALCARLSLDAAPSREEYFESALRAPTLRQLAQQTGGRYYTPATIASLPEDLRYSRGGVTVTERKELWDLPATFLLLGGLLAAEWALRRREGLA